MNKTTNERTTFFTGISTLDALRKNFKVILFLALILLFSSATYAGHSILDLVDPSFNPQIQTNAFLSKAVQSIVVQPDGKILAAGIFNSYNRQSTGKIIRLNSDGTLDSTFANQMIEGFARSPSTRPIILQPDGKIILLGAEIIVSGQTASPKKIVRLNSDGSYDTSFNLAQNDIIHDSTIDSLGRLVLGGVFQTNENGSPTTRYVIRFNADGSLDNTFQFALATAPFFVKVAAQNEKAVVAVSFGNPVQIYRLNESGAADSSFALTQVSGITKLLVQPNGKILVLSGISLLRMNENGGTDGNFQIVSFSSQSNPALDLSADGKIILANGSDDARRIRRFLPSGAIDSSFSEYVHPAFSALAANPDGGVLVGDYLNAGNSVGIQNSFLRLSANGLLDSSFNAGGIGFQTSDPGNIRSINWQTDGKILLGGRFDEINNTARYKIARLNPDASLDNSFQVNISGTGNYFSIIREIFNARAQSDGKVVVTGNFSYVINGVTKSNLVRLNSDGGIDPTFVLSDTVPDLFTPNSAGTNRFAALGDGKIIIGNSRTSPNHLPLKLTAAGIRDTSFSPTIYSTFNSVYIFDIAVQPDGKILIGGRHRQVGQGVPKSFIARLNADGSTDSTFQISEEADREISAFALLPNGKILIVRGGYANATVPVPSVVLRLNADGSADDSFNAGTGANARINTILALPTGKIFVGGKFQSFNNQPRQNLAQLTVDGNLDPTVYELNNEVLSLAADNDGRVLVGGGFTVINAGGGGANRSYIARLVDSSQANGRTRFDFDGDGRADLGVFAVSTGVWSVAGSQNSQTASTRFGFGTDKIAPADYDGDGKTDIAVYRPSDGVWYLLKSRDGFGAVRWGAAEDKPVAADFDGDGKADVAVWRPSNGGWYILQSSNGQAQAFQFGASADVPLTAADYDGDGKADVAVWRPSNGFFYWLASGSNYQFRAVQFGQTSDVPAAADYNGDGKTDLVVFRPNQGVWYQYLTTASGGYAFSAVRFGQDGDVPVAADYDGDGKADIAVRRQNNWYLLRSNQGFTGVTFGDANSQAIASLPN